MMNWRRLQTVPRQRTVAGMMIPELVAVIAILIAILVVLVLLFLPVKRGPRATELRTKCRNNLKQIGLGLYSYHEKYGVFPPACTVDAEGRPLHSWRTLILPFCDEQSLYNRIDLSKPWDDPANEEARRQIVWMYFCPSLDGDDRTLTNYQAIVSPGSFFQAIEPRKLEDVTDPLASTLLVTEVQSDEAAHWMAPIDSDGTVFKQPKTGFSHPGGSMALMANGVVRYINVNIDESAWQKLLTCAENDATDLKF